MHKLTVANSSDYEMYLIDMQISQEFETKLIALEFSVAPHAIASSAVLWESKDQYVTIPRVGNTWREQFDRAAERFKPECLLITYFSKNDSGLATISEHYEKQGTSLGTTPASAVIRYRLSNSPDTKIQKIELVATLMHNQNACK